MALSTIGLLLSVFDVAFLAARNAGSPSAGSGQALDSHGGTFIAPLDELSAHTVMSPSAVRLLADADDAGFVGGRAFRWGWILRG
jgi:hypothetical protein